MMTPTNATIPSLETVTESRMHYPLPWAVGKRLLWAALWGKKRSFARDARAGVALLKPPLQILGFENIPAQGPCLLTTNHYNRPGFSSWWLTFAASACLPFELHWVISDAWRFEGHPFARRLESLSRRLFLHIAQVYDFTSMPPMPPREDETRKRAEAVRSLLGYARRHACPTIGLAPEGYDMPGGALGIPPPGVGRLITHLLPHTQRILPVAVYEDQGRLCTRFGEAYTPQIPASSKPEDIDRHTSQVVMQAIAGLMPSHLRGIYS